MKLDLDPHMRLDMIRQDAIDRASVAGCLRMHVEQHGGILVGSAAELLRLVSPVPGWPTSIAEMEGRALPDLASVPGFLGLVVRSLGPGLGWEVRLDQPCDKS
jgi:hypothetical protein